MEVLTSDYKIKNIVPFLRSKLDVKRTYLWIWYADKIPPHIGISTENSYFSLKSSGKDENLPVSTILSLIDRKQIKTLLVELHESISLPNVCGSFENYQKAKVNEITCLAPIKDTLGLQFPTKLDYLLGTLEAEGKIKRYIGINLDESFTGIPFYTVDDIHARLEMLSHEG